tara:strand:- start:5023 stop:5436 length:414 start_codon:yes stop_codon:yes gene_type:complete
MQISPAKIHIFKDCSETFEGLLESFNNNYCEESIMKGVAYSHDFLNTIKFDTKNPLKKLIYSNLIAKIQEGVPLIKISNEEDGYIQCECTIFCMEDFLIGGFFMIQNTFPINHSSKCKFNVWRLNSETFLELDSHWL